MPSILTQRSLELLSPAKEKANDVKSGLLSEIVAGPAPQFHASILAVASGHLVTVWSRTWSDRVGKGRNR